MLIIAVFLSILLVGLVDVAAKGGAQSIHRPCLLLFWALVFGILFPPVFFHALLLIPIWLVWVRGHLSVRGLILCSSVAAIAPYGFFVSFAVGKHKKKEELRTQYAFESMENRVPVPQKTKRDPAIPLDESFFKQIEQQVADNTNGFRTAMLDRLHSETVRDFINSPGFGAGRRIDPSASTLAINLNRTDEVLPQPGPLPSSTLSTTDLTEPQDIWMDDFRTLHTASMLDFVYPRGFGFVVNRNKVAGFLSHGFSEPPQVKNWSLQSVVLIGLLMHAEPIAYVSNELPRMDRLAKAPTRSLNSFEELGLDEIRNGRDLFIRQGPHALHLLGAIRSVEQCVKCHGGERGDLLGAFSYSLQKKQ